MNKPLINLEGVDLHQMNQQIFSDINLKVNAGEFIYLIGETGSGKSSLLKILYGELKVSAGNITLSGINLRATDWTLPADLDPGNLVHRIGEILKPTK